MSKGMSNEKIVAFIDNLIVSMAEDPEVINRFWEEFNSQLGMREEIKMIATEILIAANNRAVPGLAKIVSDKCARSGKDISYTSKIPMMLKSLTGEKKGQPFGTAKGKEGGTFIWES